MADPYSLGMTGRLIVLVGTSSVGKSSTARRLQHVLTEPYLVVGLDHFFDMFPQDWGGHGRGPGPGFWSEVVTDPDDRPRIVTHYGDAGRRLLSGMRAAVVALLRTGNNVILDEMPVDETIVPAWRRELSDIGVDVCWVALRAPLDVIEAREYEREHGRHLGNARGHYGIGMDCSYDLVLDAAALSPDERAQSIARTVSHWHRPGGR